MSIVTKVAKMRLNYHATMLDICNVANQLGILKDGFFCIVKCVRIYC